jgi:hypothetical protein
LPLIALFLKHLLQKPKQTKANDLKKYTAIFFYHSKNNSTKTPVFIELQLYPWGFVKRGEAGAAATIAFFGYARNPKKAIFQLSVLFCLCFKLFVLALCCNH